MREGLREGLQNSDWRSREEEVQNDVLGGV